MQDKDEHADLDWIFQVYDRVNKMVNKQERKDNPDKSSEHPEPRENNAESIKDTDEPSRARLVAASWPDDESPVKVNLRKKTPQRSRGLVTRQVGSPHFQICHLRCDFEADKGQLYR